MANSTSGGDSKAQGAQPTDPTKGELNQASASEYADALSGLMGGAEPRESRPSVPEKAVKGRSKANPLLLLVLLGLSGWAGWGLYDYYLRPVAPPPPEMQRRAGSIMLFHAIDAVEAARSETGELPGDLSGLSLPRGNFEYAVVDTGYTLRLTLPGVVLSHRSGGDVQQLLRDAGVR